MVRDDLSDLSVFVAVADERSFTRAAGRLGTSQSALSHRIRRLEARLGVRLLTRSTRSVVPTEAGVRLLTTLRPAFETIRHQLDAITDFCDQPAGVIRISSADHVAETILWPVLRRLLPDYPNVNVEVTVDNGFVDIVAERYDAGVRLGDNLPKDMIAVPIGPEERQAIVASPGYLSRHPAPKTPQDLSDHNCINRRFPTLGGFSAWEFCKDGEETRVRVAGQVAFNRPEMIVEAVLAGFGIGNLLHSQVASHIAAGRLVSLLEDWCPPFPGYHLYYPSRRQNSPAFQLLVKALRYPNRSNADPGGET